MSAIKLEMMSQWRCVDYLGMFKHTLVLICIYYGSPLLLGYSKNEGSNIHNNIIFKHQKTILQQCPPDTTTTHNPGVSVYLYVCG